MGPTREWRAPGGLCPFPSRPGSGSAGDDAPQPRGPEADPPSHGRPGCRSSRPATRPAGPWPILLGSGRPEERLEEPPPDERPKGAEPGSRSSRPTGTAHGRSDRGESSGSDQPRLSKKQELPGPGVIDVELAHGAPPIRPVTMRTGHTQIQGNSSARTDRLETPPLRGPRTWAARPVGHWRRRKSAGGECLAVSQVPMISRKATGIALAVRTVADPGSGRSTS